MFGAGIMPLFWWLGWCCFVGLLVGLCGLLLVGCCYVFLLLDMVGIVLMVCDLVWQFWVV